MRIIRLPGIHHDVNATLICGEQGNYMVDVGTSWYQLLLQERLRGKIGEEGELDGIILTCRRYNHSGGAAFLKEEFSTRVFAHPNAAQALSSGDFFTTWANRYDSDMPPLETEPIIEAHSFEVGDGTFEIIELPGHCNDAIGVWQADRGVFIAGPTIPKADCPSRWDQPTGCLPDLLASVERIIQLQANTLIPAHGDSIRGAEEVAEILEKHRAFFVERIAAGGELPRNWPRPSQTCNYLTPRPSW